MKHVVITGSTRGIGFGLADAFLQRGCSVTVSGRAQESVDRASAELAARHSGERLHGQVCDVADLPQVENLWQSAVGRFGQVDIWINNAGLGHNMDPLWDLPPERVLQVVNANIIGTVYGSRVAIRGMKAQGFGQLYNMLGHGSNGRTRDGMSIYGASKAAIKHLSDALISETKSTPVQVGTLSPGMVKTDLLVDPLKADPAILERSRKIFNILSERVETVAPWLVDQMLANEEAGASIAYLTRPKLFWRFLTAPFSKRDIFDDV